MTPPRAGPLALLLLLLLAGFAPPRDLAPPHHVTVAAHRGQDEGGAAENTLGAFREAVRAGVEVIEIDLRTTADGAIVLLHDATLDRTTNGHGPVAALTLAQVKALDAGGGERVPTLAEALDVVRGTNTRLLLDLKRGGGVPPAAVVTTAREHRGLDRLVIGARSPEDVRAYSALEPSLAILGFVPDLADIDAFAAAGARTIRLWPRWIFAPDAGCRGGRAPGCIVGRLHARDLAVWTTADARGDEHPAHELFARLAALGLDGILTDRPDLAAAALARVESSRSVHPERVEGPALRERASTGSARTE